MLCPGVFEAKFRASGLPRLARLGAEVGPGDLPIGIDRVVGVVEVLVFAGKP
ncbi:hypothetical protein D9M71_767190 [compost metagenome]